VQFPGRVGARVSSTDRFIHHLAQPFDFVYRGVPLSPVFFPPGEIIHDVFTTERRWLSDPVLLEVFQPPPKIVRVLLGRSIGAISPCCGDPRYDPVFPSVSGDIEGLTLHLFQGFSLGNHLRLLPVANVVLTVAAIRVLPLTARILVGDPNKWRIFAEVGARHRKRRQRTFHQFPKVSVSD
jgi:hypothetical protein